MPQIFVGNLPYTACEAEIRNIFERFGRVLSVRLAVDSATNQPRGFGFVIMPSMDDADEAITRLSGVSLNGRTLTVNQSRESTGGKADHSVSQKAEATALAFFEKIRQD